MGQGFTGGLRVICVALAMCGGGLVSPSRAQDANDAATVTPPEAAAKPAPVHSSPARARAAKSAKTRAAATKATKATRAVAAAPAEPTGPAQSILGALHMGTSEPDMPDFVRDSRPQQLDYLPITSRGAEPDSPILTPDEIRRREADLEKLRSRHDRMAARAPAPAVKSAAPAPVVKKTKVTTPCLLTCTIKARPEAMK